MSKVATKKATQRVTHRALWAMANIPTRLTGIEGIAIYISERTRQDEKAKRGPRVKVDSLTAKFPRVNVTIAATPRIIRGTLPARVRKHVFAWVVLNQAMLMRLWARELHQQQAMSLIKSIEHTEPIAFFCPSLEATTRALVICTLVTDTRALAKQIGNEMAIAAHKDEFHIHKVLGAVGEQVTRTGRDHRWVADGRLEVEETKTFRVRISKRIPPSKRSPFAKNRTQRRPVRGA